MATLQCRYELTVVARCPVNDGVDVYQTSLVSWATIMVEDVLAAVADLRDQRLTQEEITAQLADRFACTVTTTGLHSGVATTVEAKP